MKCACFTVFQVMPQPVEDEAERTPEPKGFSLAWENIDYSVNASKNPFRHSKKQILSAIIGVVQPGKIMALMGPSGSGKSTLLDILADRIGPKGYQGTVLVNGKRRSSQKFKNVASYVSVTEHFYEVFSVFETLMFTARMTKFVGNESKSLTERVESALDRVGLTDSKHTWVGGDIFRGLSTGQKKRLGIAQELLRDPWIFLLDEPLSGLDGTGASELMSIFQGLASEGKTIVLSLHQPVSRIWEMLDKITLISEGKLLYTGATENVIKFLENSSGKKMRTNYNPGDFMLDLVNRDFKYSQNSNNVPDLIRLQRLFTESDYSKTMTEEILEEKSSARCGPVTIRSTHANFAVQLALCTRRAIMNNCLHVGMYWLRIAIYLLLSLVIGGMYSEIEKVEPIDKAGMIYTVQSYVVTLTLAALPYMIKVIPIFCKERRSGLVQTIPFVLSAFLASLPGILVSASVCAVIIFYTSGVVNFGWFFAILFCTLLCAESTVSLIASLTNEFIIGLAISSGIFGIFMINSGFLLPSYSIPNKWFTVWRGFYYIAFHMYLLRSLLYNQFSHGKYVTGNLPKNGPTLSSEGQSEILVKYDIADVVIYEDALVLIGYAMVLQVLLTFIVFFKHTGKR